MLRFRPLLVDATEFTFRFSVRFRFGSLYTVDFIDFVKKKPKSVRLFWQ